MSGRTLAEPEVEVVVEKIDTPAAGVRELVLRAPAGTELPLWTPGAHIDVEAGGYTRQYSLCGDPFDVSTWRIAILREPDGRGGSAYMHDKVSEGTTLRVRGPRNHFALEPSPTYIFIAGGIGITPILPMITESDASGADWTLAYGGRTRSSIAYGDELVAQYADRVQVLPADETGLLDLNKLIGEPRADTMVYCCGPEPLLRAVEERCASWLPGALHIERFAPKQQAEPVLTESFEVELSDSRRTLTVPPDKSILAVLEDAGIDVLSSCTEGTCGTCETVVLDGQVDHRDSLLTPAEQAANDVMFVCVSRGACDKLVLEL